MANAFGAFGRIDFVDFKPHGDSLIRAFGFTHITVDAFVSDDQRHAF
jgi:hypothetical protein